MGRKRKADSEGEIKKKIRKLERKLLKVKKYRRIIYSSNESLSESPTSTVQHDSSPKSPSPIPTHEQFVTTAVVEPPPSALRSVEHARSPPTPVEQPSPSQERLVLPDMNDVTENEVSIDIDLDDEILTLLGDAPKLETPLGPPIHKDVANRWQDILAKGLSKDTKDKIFDEYLIPSNCDFLVAPTLNPEAKAALSEQMIKRDSFLMHKPKQLGCALSALASATSMILANERSKQKLLKPISDACRLLCDNHFVETKSRRNLVISSTNTQLKDTLTESVRLFGEYISEKLKTAKTIQKSGEDLKSLPKTMRRSNFQVNNRFNRNPLNCKPHRKTDKKIPFSSDGARRPPPRAPPRPPAPPPPAPRNTRRSSPPRRNPRH